MTEVITIVSDGNPDLDQAADILAGFVPSGKVASYGPTVGIDGLYAYIEPDARKEIVAALTAAKFRIIEGGQQ